MDLQLKPFFLGGVMKESGNKPLALVPNKGVYMIKDIQRLGKYYGIPLNQPKDFGSVMFGTLPVQRFLTAVDMAHPEYTEELSRQFWFRIWKNDEPVTDPQHYAEAAKKAGLCDDAIATALKRMKDQDVKDRLAQYTKQALDEGAFGSPWIVAHINGKKESIFGSDRFPILAMLLGKRRMAWPIKGIIKAVNKQGICFGKFFEVMIKLSGGSKIINGRNYELCPTAYTGTTPIIILEKEVIG